MTNKIDGILEDLLKKSYCDNVNEEVSQAKKELRKVIFEAIEECICYNDFKEKLNKLFGEE